MSDIRFNRWLHQSGTGGVSQDSSGNIGIGTTVPIMALDIRGDVNIGDTININNASGIISATTLTATTLTATTGTFSGDISVTGNVSIAGTLTYEDVSNIDAVGIITAQSDIIVGGGLTVTGISTFNNDVKLLDSDKLKFGIGEDLQIYHDPGTGDSFISETGAGNLKLTTSSFRLRNAADTEHIIWANQDAEVRLYHDNSKKFETTSSGAIVTGILTATTFSGNLTGNVTGDLTGNLAGITSIASISSSISDTAIDVFVYDTRKDSDGGAWRKRTQNTSWYNETLGTATRGSRKEFPAVAVIVAESDKVTIYDGDDPDLPMWMVFNDGVGNNAADSTFLGTINAPISSILMLNGVLCVGFSSTGGWGVSEIGFVSDSQRWWWTTGIYKQPLNSIDKRNVGSGYLAVDTSASVQLVNALVNDVAMTVLPNAPIDDTTGLSIPTIAVATENGVSVIKDDGIVVDIIQNSPYTQSNNVFFSDYGKILYDMEDTSVVYEVDIPSADIGYGAYNSTANGRVIYPTGTHGGFSSGQIRLLGRNMSNGGKLITKGAFAFDANGASEVINGLTLFDREESNPAFNSLLAFVASDYNTGWMHGDVKGAFLSDTDTGADFGPEIVTGGDFSNASQWTLGTGWSINGSGQAVHTGSAGYIEQTGSFTGGRYYQITADLVSGGSAGNFGMTNRNESGVAQPHSGSTYVDVYCVGNTGGKIYAMWQQRSGVNLTTINLYANNSGTMVIDNVSIKEISRFYYDRTVNNKPLALIGSLTKSAVATGAELVAYSGFSASNYLKQSYNSSMDFGTGDFSIMFWFKTPTGSVPTECFLHRGDGGTGTWGSGKIIQIEFNSTNLAAFLSESAFSSYDTVTVTGTKAATGQWMHYTLVRSGTSVKAYLNGEVNGTASSSRNLTNTSASTWIGERPNSSRPATTSSLALFRMSASAPSPEQIKKMYEDEKCLFHENAKATLSGSSDAVTALAYDDTTNLLHVGTSAGRSEFQGLRRINNTTDAVTTAISASNGLVAEQ